MYFVLDLLPLVLVEEFDADLFDCNVGVGTDLLPQIDLAHHSHAQHVLEVDFVLANYLRLDFAAHY